jgi:hypothetical protein
MPIKRVAESKDLFQKIQEENKSFDSSNEKANVQVKESDSLENFRKEFEELKKSFKSVLEKNEKLENSLRKTKESSNESYLEDLADDWVDEGVSFFTYTYKTSLWGDKRNGTYIPNPNNGVILFKPLLRTKRNVSGKRGSDVVSVSMYVSNSKREIEYLRNHSKYGIAFHETLEKAANVDYSMAMKLSECNNLVESLSDQQVIVRSQQEGLTLLSDVKIMRQRLTETLATKSIKGAKEKLYGHLSKADERDRLIQESIINS